MTIRMILAATAAVFSVLPASAPLAAASATDTACALRVASRPETRREQPRLVCPGTVDLASGNRPKTIYVRSFDVHGQRVPAFALRETGPFFLEGLSWKSDRQPVFVTFVFSTDIARVTTQYGELACSPSYEGRQHMLIPPYPMVYDFDVEFADGELYDPKIIITPVTEAIPPARP